MKLICLGSTILPFLTFSLPAMAASVSFTGDLTGAPSFDSPVAGTPPNSTVGLGDIFPYVSEPFFVTNSGSYDFLSQTTGFTTPPETSVPNGPTNWYNVTILYSNSFDPANPLNNAVIAANYSLSNSPSISSGFNGINLISNTQYFFVTTVYDPDDGYGTFNNTISETFISSPNDIILGTLPPATVVPEPTTFPATLLLISGALVLRKRQRRQF